MGRRGHFLAEGEVVLRVLLQSAHVVRSVLLGRKQWRRLGDWVQTATDAPILVADDATLEATVGFELHRGILALAERAASPDLATLLAPPGARTIVGLFGISNHDNVGGIFRNLAAFGADAAVLDEATCDPLYRKALRVSVGGVLRVPYVRGGRDVELAQALSAAGYELLALSPSGSASLRALRPGPRRALLLGAEGPGLSPEILQRARGVRLDMAAGFDSLNVATTSGIAL